MLFLSLGLARYHEAHNCQNSGLDKAVLLVLTYVQLSIGSSNSHQISNVVLCEKNRLLSYLIFKLETLCPLKK